MSGTITPHYTMNYRSFSTLAFMHWDFGQFPVTRNVSAFCAKSQAQTQGMRRNLLSDCKKVMTSHSFSSASAGLGMMPEQDTSSSTPSVYLASSENHEFQNVLEDLSLRHSLPILAQESDDHHDSSYSHCVHLLPYEFSSLQSYAIGIQPIRNSSESNTRRNKRKRSSSKKKNMMRPIYIDFFPMSSSSLGKRSQKADGEMLLKAISPSKYGSDNPLGGAVVYDLCAGFAQDSMLLASSMKIAKVHMVERDPIVGLLLEDALRRLDLISSMNHGEDADGDKAKILLKKIDLSLEDSVSFCKNMLRDFDREETPTFRPDVCYLDPMFPPRTKSAAVKKNMQVLHGLFQTNELSSNDGGREREERDLLVSALSLSKSRVVVKRPVNAPPLGYRRDENGSFMCSEEIPRPSFELKGSINRFDVYMLL